jgi:integrase
MADTVNLMAEILFDADDVQQLIDRNSAPPHGIRNAALILAGVYWGLTPYEMSVVSVEDVMDSKGTLYRIWVLPASRAYNGKERELWTDGPMLKALESYIQWRIAKKLKLRDPSSYRGLDPESKLFLNDWGKDYTLFRREGRRGKTNYYPRSMNEQLKRMIEKTNLQGATPASFRDSYVREAYNNGAGYKDLMRMSGIKQKRTLENKIRPQAKALEEVMDRMFARVTIPEAAQ